MKRISLIIVSTILAVAILFGVSMGQTNTAHAASISYSTQSLNALVAKVEQHVHVVNHHATIDSQLQGIVSQAQFQTAQQAVTLYNELAGSAHNTLPVPAQQPSNSHAVSKTLTNSSGWWYCLYISNGTMDTIAWSIIFFGGVATIAGILITIASVGWGAAIAIAAVIIGIGGAYLLWYSDKYWGNGTTWCSNGSSVYYYAD